MNTKRTKLSGGFNNDIYYLEEENKILRISDKKKTIEMIEQEVDWMTFLSNKGIILSKPDPKMELNEGRVSTYFEYIEGEAIDVTNDSQWKDDLFEEMGRILGKMHTLSKKFEVENVYRPKWTREQPDVYGIQNGLDSWLRESFDQLMESLFKYEISPATYGLIHNDFHQGNFIINMNGFITIIDFDDCAFNWFAQDIAVLFYHAYWQHTSFNGDGESFVKTFMSHFLKGYQKENTIHPDTVKQIPIFLKLREIYLYQLFKEKWDIHHLAEWQCYTLQDLEEKIKSKYPYGGITDFKVYLK